MHNGSQPFISSESVHAALDAMVYTSTAQPPSPLESLAIVDHFISNPDLPLIAENREFALHQILISLITREYMLHRHNLGLSSPVLHAPLELATRDIRDDAQQHNPELTGWCLLYYRYVRVDLGLTIESIMPLAHIEQRTLRRYHNHATERLRDRLISEEWKRRIERRKVRLYANLPVSAPIPLIGRDKTLQQLQAALVDESLRHVLVTGPAGIGKSVLVQEFLRQQIDDERIDYLIWVENPGSVDFVRRYMHEAFLGDRNTSLKEFTLTYNVAIVLDHFDCTSHECAGELQILLGELSSALVFVTSRIYIPLFQRIQHVPIKEMDEQDALTLIQNVMTAFEGKDFDREYARLIYKTIGGNPYALTLTAHKYNIYHMSTPFADVLAEVFNQTYESIEIGTRHVWLIFALCPTGEVSMDVLCRLWPSTVTQNRIVTLLDHYLIHAGQRVDYFVIPTSSRSFIRTKFVTSPGILESLIEELDRLFTDELPFAFEIIEHILLSDWPESRKERAQRWINTCLKEALRRGRYARWVSIIESYHKRHGSADISLNIALGMCLRRVSQWLRARQVLEQAVLNAGSVGQFYEQGRALIELGILYRQQGFYEKSAVILEKAETILARYNDADVLNDLCVEHAQAALDGGDIAQAQVYLRDLPPTGRVLAMLCEVYFLQGDFVQSLDQAQQAVSLSGDNQVAVGRLYVTIGRIYDRRDEPDTAFNYFARAITILEREGDVWALARARSNLAAHLIRLGNSYEAYDLLSKAENVQVGLGDQVGLEITRHNFRVLRGGFGG
jgi:tetratricopeptide (TPR) repeat protein